LLLLVNLLFLLADGPADVCTRNETVVPMVICGTHILMEYVYGEFAG